MSKLRDVLLTVQRGDTKGGSVAYSDAALKQLSTLQRNLAIQGWLIFAAVFAGAVLAICAAVLKVDNAKELAAVSGGLGLSVAGALELLRRTWREFGRINLLLTLLDNASEAQVATLIDKLIKDLPS